MDSQAAEMRRLKAELKRVTQARDIEKGRGVLCQDVRVRCTFIVELQHQLSVRRLCKVLGVHPSRFYAWRLNPESKRVEEDKRLLVPIKESWLESGSAKPPASITWAYGKELCAGRFSEHRSRGTPTVFSRTRITYAVFWK